MRCNPRIFLKSTILRHIPSYGVASSSILFRSVSFLAHYFPSLYMISCAKFQILYHRCEKLVCKFVTIKSSPVQVVLNSTMCVYACLYGVASSSILFRSVSFLAQYFSLLHMISCAKFQILHHRCEKLVCKFVTIKYSPIQVVLNWVFLALCPRMVVTMCYS